jgi:hypothetical protein
VSLPPAAATVTVASGLTAFVPSAGVTVIVTPPAGALVAGTGEADDPVAGVGAEAAVSGLVPAPQAAAEASNNAETAAGPSLDRK